MEEQKKEEQKVEESPLGPDIVPVIHIIYNKKLKDYGILGANGFLNDRAQAYAALKLAEKSLDEFYAKQNKFRDNFMAGARMRFGKQGFRNFLKRGK